MKKILSIPIISITSVVGADLSHQNEILPMEDLLLDRTYSIYVPRIRPPEVSIHEVVQKIIDQQLPLIELFDEELES